MIRHLTENNNLIALLNDPQIPKGDILMVTPNWWLYAQEPLPPAPPEEELTLEKGWKFYLKGDDSSEPIASLTEARRRAKELQM